MKKETGKYLAILLGIICIILAIILIYVKVMAANNKSDEKDLNNKIEEEIKYLDSNLIDLMNKLNNITVINYKVYTREINESSNSDQTQSQAGNNGSSSSQGGASAQNGGSGGQENGSGNQGGTSAQGGNQGRKCTEWFGLAGWRS